MNHAVTRTASGRFWRAGRTVWGLCSAYNHATNPARFLTDHESHRSCQYARAIRNRMRRLGLIEGRHYAEMNSGRYWPLNIHNYR
jgi:hypothetical protein